MLVWRLFVLFDVGYGDSLCCLMLVWGVQWQA